MSDQRLQGKVALVSGGATGTGAAVVRRCAREGAAIVFGDINEEAGAALQREIAESGGQARFVPLDVTDRGQWKAAIDATLQAHGRLDVLVNNAALTAGMTSLPSTSIGEFFLFLKAMCKTGRFSVSLIFAPLNIRSMALLRPISSASSSSSWNVSSVIRFFE